MTGQYSVHAVVECQHVLTNNSSLEGAMKLKFASFKAIISVVLSVVVACLVLLLKKKLWIENCLLALLLGGFYFLLDCLLVLYTCVYLCVCVCMCALCVCYLCDLYVCLLASMN